MLSDDTEERRGVRVGEFLSVADGELPSRATVTVLPLAKIPLLREVVLLVGDGRPVVDVGTALVMLARDMRIPTVARMMGTYSLQEVWAAGCDRKPPLFYEEGGLHKVDHVLLQQVRAQLLNTCSCGAHFEVGLRCYICVHRKEWERMIREEICTPPVHHHVSPSS